MVPAWVTAPRGRGVRVVSAGEKEEGNVTATASPTSPFILLYCFWMRRWLNPAHGVIDVRLRGGPRS